MKKSCHLVPKVIDLPFEGRKVEGSLKYSRRERVQRYRGEETIAPATLEAARHAARDVSLYKGAQSRPSTSSGTTQRRPFSSSSASRGHTQSSAAPATPQHSQASSSSKRFTPQKRSSDPPKKHGGFRR